MTEAGRTGATNATQEIDDPRREKTAIDLHLIVHRFFNMDLESLANAIALARVEKVTLDASLLARGLIDEEALYRGLAQALGVPFVTRPFRVSKGYPHEMLVSSGIARVDGLPAESAVIAAPRGAFFEDLVLRVFAGDAAPPIILTTPSNFRQSIMTQFGEARADHDVGHLHRVMPAFSAERLTLRSFLGLMMIVPVLFLLGLLAETKFWSMGLYALSGFLAAPSLVFKSLIIAMKRDQNVEPLLTDSELPPYTILLPLHREADVVPRLLDHMLKLDYPRSKLQIILLAEEGDDQTREAIAVASHFSHIETIICPEGLPKTKPRALAIGQAYAKGEIIVVFDAEDMPDPLQLKRAASVFARAPQSLGCVQASLAIYNPGDSWISRLFSFEYAVLFDVIIPGMARLHMPIPLGGTSNHLRRSALLAVNGWDPWNVTEDADLGLRLSRFGYETRWLSSTTYEEAPFEMKIWIRQRTRWFKGWMQTFIIHLGLTGREKHKALRKISLVDHVLIVLVATTSFATSLYHPLLLILATMAIHYRESGFGVMMVDPTIILLIGSLLFLHLTFNLMLLQQASNYRRFRLTLTDFMLHLPYSLMKMIAAWRALVELFIAPSHWHKTPHGRARSFSILRDHAN